MQLIKRFRRWRRDRRMLRSWGTLDRGEIARMAQRAWIQEVDEHIARFDRACEKAAGEWPSAKT